MLSLPQILRIPDKVLPVLTTLGDYKFIVLEGGRGSAKTQTAGRILLYVGEKRKVRITCGRELQGTIEESVHAVLGDLIKDNALAWHVGKKRIRHYLSASEFMFKGFREQGAINVKGLEGVDIIWIDEAETITKPTLDKLIPTIRKSNCILIFTMNRYMRDDAVIQELVGRHDCLHIQINYTENPYCPLTLKHEAETMRNKNPKEYRHIWLGEPLAQADDYLFNYDKLWDSLEVKPFGELFFRQRILSIDFAAQGNDMCVASILDRVSAQHWQLTEQIAWGEPDTTISVGKIINLIGTHKPDITILDVGGGGHNVHCDLTKAKLQVYRFDGGSTDGVDKELYKNQRAEGYYLTKEWFEQGFLKVLPENKDVIKQLEKIKMRWHENGVRAIESKIKMKQEVGHSPDEADSLMMAIYAATKYLGKASNTNADIPERAAVRRVAQRRRR